jgi:hypothetical protein
MLAARDRPFEWGAVRGPYLGAEAQYFAAQAGERAEGKEVRTSFCEQKEAKKLYSFQCRAVSPPREAEQKSFLVLFFKKELLDFTS